MAICVKVNKWIIEMSTLVVGYSGKKLIVTNTSFTSSSINFQVEFSPLLHWTLCNRKIYKVSFIPLHHLLVYVRTQIVKAIAIICKRMHSSRMRTIRCSGVLSCHACPPPPLGMHASQARTPKPPPRKQNDRRL